MRPAFRSNWKGLLVSILVLWLSGVGVVRPATAQSKRPPDAVKIIENALSNLRHLTDADFLNLIESGQISLDACSVDSLSAIQTALGAMKEVVAAERKLGVSGSFSMSDTQSRTVRDSLGSVLGGEKQSLSTSVSMSSGNYPFEVDLRSSVSISKSNPGAIQEDISSLFMSVDYHPRALWYETFGFVNRTTDAFLSIDQRYELGGGIVFSWFQGWTNKGEGIKSELGVDSLYTSDAPWIACYNEIQQMLESGSTADDTFLDTIKHARDVAENSLKKDHARARFALLIGALGELEQASLAGMALHDRGWRFEVRPTIAWSPLDVLSMRLDWYLKARIGGFDASPGELHLAKLQFCESTNNIFPSSRCGKDIRSELIFTITQKFNDNIEFELRHERWRDYLPPFVVFSEAEQRDPIVAAWRRNNTRLAVRISL